MGKFLDALMMKKAPTNNAGMFYGPNTATEGQPVPVAMAIEPMSDLSGPSALSRAAIGAWPEPLDALGARLRTPGGWVKSSLVEVRAKNVIGNYGSITSSALFGFLFQTFKGVGNYPAEGTNNPYVHEYNELTPIVWSSRVPNNNTPSNTTQQKGSISIQNKPATWEGSNNASLVRTGVTLL